jgi:hypothetical protein
MCQITPDTRGESGGLAASEGLLLPGLQQLTVDAYLTESPAALLARGGGLVGETLLALCCHFPNQTSSADPDSSQAHQLAARAEVILNELTQHYRAPIRDTLRAFLCCSEATSLERFAALLEAEVFSPAPGAATPMEALVAHPTLLSALYTNLDTPLIEVSYGAIPPQLTEDAKGTPSIVPFELMRMYFGDAGLSLQYRGETRSCRLSVNPLLVPRSESSFTLSLVCFA